MESKAKWSLCSKSKKKKTKLHEYEETKGLMHITMINHTQKHAHTKFPNELHQLSQGQKNENQSNVQSIKKQHNAQCWAWVCQLISLVIPW